MTSHWNMVQAITVKYHDKIKKACAPVFNYLNINEFWYYKITERGDKVYFGSNPEWSEYYASQNYNLVSPINCHPKFYRPGVYTFTSVKSLAESKALPEAKKRFNINPSLLIIGRIDKGIEGFGVSSASSEYRQTERLLTELPLLKLFFKKLQSEEKAIFSKLEEYGYNLKELLGSKFYENQFQQESNQKDQRAAFLNGLGIFAGEPLTFRESAVCKLLLLGFSAGQIALQIHLSKRTVEHRIERLKEKLRCFSKAELIQKIRELEELGCF